METISAAAFKATCIALLDKVERTGRTICVTRRGEPVAQLVPVQPAGKRKILGSMAGSAKIVGDIRTPATLPSDWEILLP